MMYENTSKFKFGNAKGFRLEPKRPKTKKVKRDGKNRRKDHFVQKGS